MESRSRAYIITSCLVFFVLLLPVSIFVAICVAYLFANVIFAILGEYDTWLESCTYVVSIVIFFRALGGMTASSIASIFGPMIGLVAKTELDTQQQQIYERA